MRHAFAICAAVVAVVACEPVADEPEVEAGSLAITAFVPSGRVDCGAGCAIDLGEIDLGTVRDTPLQFLADGVVVVSAIDRAGCEAFSMRPPGDLSVRATTSIRLVTDAADAPGVCATTFTAVTDASNAGDDGIDIDVSATLVDGAAGGDDLEDVPG